MFKSILLCLSLIFASTIVFAQDSDDYFPILENCIPEPTLPPDDWTYNGTIMMSGYAGIHGINADWDTPHVLVFNSRAQNGHEPLIGEALSPDGQWYAVPMGETWVEITYSHYTWVHGIRVYRTNGSREFLEYENNYDFYIYSAVAWSYLPVQWVDNESLVIGLIHLYPFEDRAEPASFEVISSLASISPDMSIVYSGYGDSINLSYTKHDTTITQDYLGNIAWKHDSTGFMSINSQNDTTNLNYINRDGELVKLIMRFDEGRVNIRRGVDEHNELRWSSDNTRFAFK